MWQVKGNSEEEDKATLVNEALENAFGQGIDISPSCKSPGTFAAGRRRDKETRNGIYLILSGGRQGPEFLRNWVLRVETKQDCHAADSCINCKWLKILKRFFSRLVNGTSLSHLRPLALTTGPS